MLDRAVQPEAPATEKIKITPEMIEAGARIYLRESDDTFKEIVAEIYRAMEGCRRGLGK
jgi:hypothetical protein